MEVKSTPSNIIQIKSKKNMCPECGAHSSTKYLKKHNKCSNCVKLVDNVVPQHNTRSVNKVNSQSKIEMMILKKIIDIYYESMNSEIPLIDKLVKANLAIDEYIVERICECDKNN